MKPVLLEVCVQSPADCLAAARGGADRVELCQAIELGGLTPSLGMVSAACERSPLPVIVLARPRPGDFVYTREEVDLVKRDLERISESGARGVALGALTPDGGIDLEAIESWREASGELELVFHRAFDSCQDPLGALSLLADRGVRRVLTSGGAPTATEGAATLAGWIEIASGRIEILPAGTIRAENVAALVETTGADQVHFRAPALTGSAGARPALGTSDTGQHEVTDAEAVRAVRDALA
ncbi:MAG: copper homeostasis protein CutC [Planctomycetes bacterium]|nr:copper homeostasis protein CutC [Planctomycetota bacterium]